jgi:acyl-[acyl-carrier-protein] desaturase
MVKPIDPKIQSRLIRDLEPAVAKELDRHLATTKNWYPHEYVPWSEGRTFAGPLNGDAWEAQDSKLTSVAQDSLVLNLMTEDNLPSYHTEIAIAMGQDGAWGTWINRWTAEEARHSIVLRDYLMATRGVDPV